MASVVASVKPTVRPVAARAAAPRVARRSVLLRATAPKKEAIEQAIKEAEDACSGGTTGECAAAWDTVEELSAAASHAKDQKKAEYVDPLEQYCAEAPDADECKVFDD